MSDMGPKKVGRYASPYWSLRSIHGAMIQRCTNPKRNSWRDYGARGITVCDRWRGKNGYANFVKDIPPRPSLLHTLDRIENDGNYEPGNMRWATREEQTANQRSNCKLTLNGKTQHASAWARELGIPENTILHRARKGLSATECLSVNKLPIRNLAGRNREVVIEGQSMRIKDACKKIGIKPGIVYYRMNTLAMTINEAMFSPVKSRVANA